MLEHDLILQIMNYKDHYLKAKIKCNLLKKEFAALRPKTHSYLTDDNYENKKAKCTKKCVIKQKPKF